MSDSGQVDELLQFLLPESPAITKGPAVCYLLGMTATEDGLTVFRQRTNFINALCTLVMRDSSPTIVGKAYECILNISSHEDLALHVVSSCNEFVKHCLIPDALDISKVNVTKACASLANLTQTKESAAKVWSLLEPSADNLLNVFCRKSKHSPHNGASVSKDQTIAPTEAKDDTLQDHIAFVFSNLTMLSSVRTWFTDPEQQRLEKLFPFISMSTTTQTRKHGAVGTIRNCTFDTEHHQWLLKKVDILPRLLCPLIGPEVEENLDEEDMEKLPIDCQYLGAKKKMEESAEIRKMLVEALNQLCATRFGRNFLKENGTYFVLRELHKVEKERPVLVACENLVDILIQDEPKQDNLKEVDIPADLVEKFKKMDTEILQDDN
ncbi:hypothetical protein BIW11_07962 [Tropilaelaps mercedesae]|uniref:Protein HGH1 homolog n=1 Tax=Tropilaelaps mercedesae TaxID=418985 RepID=A0A1V9XS07_9ACAR|nr:hypothetical protein BIW11_07962 [Tropilaelaps mercedesae]